jgi:hypothetical protein
MIAAIAKPMTSGEFDKVHLGVEDVMSVVA